MLSKFLKLFLSLPKRNQQIVGAVVLLLVSVGISSIAISRQQPVRFLLARRVVDPSFLEMVIQDNYAGSSQLEPKVFRRDGFLIFDFNSQELCGVAGCLYAAYANGDHLSFYLKQVPKTVSLFSFERQGLANCFVTSQSVAKGIIRTRYCHQQGKLAKIITELKDKKTATYE
jgi:hypothetical protein